MRRFIKPTISPSEVDSLLKEGYSNLNPNFIIREVLRVLGVKQKEYSRFLNMNDNYISDRLSNSNSKKFTLQDIFTLKYYVEANYPRVKFDSILRDIIISEGLESLTSATVIRRYEWVIKELIEANQFSYAEYQAKLSGSNAWV